MRLRVDQWTACRIGLEVRPGRVGSPSGMAAAERVDSTLALAPILRRRVSALGQMAFRAACNLTVPEHARFIFCSRHGEFQRTLNILTALAAGEDLSPAEFSLSVHNALAGLLAIAWRNTAGHTTIAAGADTFESALIEAASCLMETPDVPVLLVYFDDRLPEPYGEIGDSGETCVALAILLTAPHHDGNDIILEPPPHEKMAAAESASGQAMSFIRFLLAEEADEEPSSQPTHRRWRRA